MAKSSKYSSEPKAAPTSEDIQAEAAAGGYDQAIFAQGVSDAGKGITENPFTEGTPQAESWAAGAAFGGPSEPEPEAV